MNENAMNTLTFLERAAQAPNHANDPELMLGLMAVCRKIDIGKRLFIEYDHHWGNPKDGKLLDADKWPQALSALANCTEKETRRAYRLKLANTLLKGFDLAQALAAGATDNPALNKIKSKLDALLETLD